MHWLIYSSVLSLVLWTCFTWWYLFIVCIYLWTNDPFAESLHLQRSGKIETVEARNVKVLLVANPSDENKQIHLQRCGKLGRLKVRNVKVLLVANPTDENEQILLYNACPHEVANARRPKPASCRATSEWKWVTPMSEACPRTQFSNNH